MRPSGGGSTVGSVPGSPPDGLPDDPPVSPLVSDPEPLSPTVPTHAAKAIDVKHSNATRLLRCAKIGVSTSGGDGSTSPVGHGGPSKSGPDVPARFKPSSGATSCSGCSP